MNKLIELLHALGLNRDSAVWFWGKVVGLAGMVVYGLVKPAELGLSDVQAHWLTLLAALVLYMSGQLSTSALPGKAKP